MDLNKFFEDKEAMKIYKRGQFIKQDDARHYFGIIPSIDEIYSNSWDEFMRLFDSYRGTKNVDEKQAYILYRRIKTVIAKRDEEFIASKLGLRQSTDDENKNGIDLWINDEFGMDIKSCTRPSMFELTGDKYKDIQKLVENQRDKNRLDCRDKMILWIVYENDEAMFRGMPDNIEIKLEPIWVYLQVESVQFWQLQMLDEAPVQPKLILGDILYV